MADIASLLSAMVDQHASDLHLKPAAPPFVRVNGRLVSLDMPAMAPDELNAIGEELLPANRRNDYLEFGQADFAIGVSGVGRFRASLMRQRGSTAVVLRRVPITPPSFDILGLPTQVRQLAERRSGLLLVTGPADAGKTTTIATMINHINDHAPLSVIAIEDPIEILHADKKAYITQREIGTDTHDHLSGLEAALRHDPDVIVVDRIDDAATMAAVISAASSHLIIATLPALNATEAVTKMVDFFPPHQARQIRHSIGAVLQGIISQRLLDREDGQGRVAVFELLVSTSRTRDSIVQAPDAHELEHLISTGEYYGMQTLDQHLAQLHKSRLISTRDALAVATHPKELRASIESTTA